MNIDKEGFVMPKGRRSSSADLERKNMTLRPVDYMTDAELQATPAGRVFVYDAEVYINFFYVAFKDVMTGKVIDFELSPSVPLNAAKLRFLLWRFLLVGFNSRSFDIYILLAALNGMNNADLKAMSNDIIYNELRGFDIERKYKINVPNVNHVDLIEVAPLSASLKTYGGRLHCQRMQDLPFPHDAVLTYDEAQYVKNYCVNDLDITALMAYELREQLTLREQMSVEYDIDLRSKSDAQVAEAVIGKEIAKISGQYPRKPTIQAGTQFRYIAPDYMAFRTPAFQSAFERVKAALFTVSNSGEPLWPEGLGEPEKTKGGEIKWVLKCPLGGSVYKMGMGGLHSTEKTVSHVADANTIISDHDVESFYPRIILNQGLYPKHLGEAFLKVYERIVNRRVEAKRSGNKVVADSLKITINGSFGKLGSKYSILYAPDLLLQVTISGQFSLMMLIELFELNGIPVISANTDGIVVKCPTAKLALRDALIKEWEAVTNFKTEETRYLAVYSRDVNNYYAVKQKQDKKTKAWLPEADGVKTKGAYSNPWADPKLEIFRFHKNPETTILIEAVEAYITKGVPLKKTIEDCKDIRKFVAVRTVKGGGHKDGVYLGKVVRWYYAEGEFTAIHYVGSGNKVPKTLGAKPIMDLPEAFPNDLNYGHYIKEATDILVDIACVTKSETARLI
jgi:hypothetical protein